MEEKARYRRQLMLGVLFALSLCLIALGITGSAGLLLAGPNLGKALLAGIIVLGVYLGHCLGREETSRLAEMRRQMAKLFATIVIESPQDERFAFDGRTATIIEDDETLSVNDQAQLYYEVRRYARNPGGEYFWFILAVAGGKPNMVFVKHVPHNIARFVLKDKYVPPPEHLP